MAVVYVGAVAPEAFVLNVTPGTSGVDLSTVSAASLKVLKPTGEEESWSATRSNQTATTLTCSHTFVTGDVDEAGVYVVYASLTVPGGTYRTKPKTFTVKPRFDWS